MSQGDDPASDVISSASDTPHQPSHSFQYDKATTQSNGTGSGHSANVPICGEVLWGDQSLSVGHY